MNELIELYKTNELEIADIEKKISIAITELQNKQKELQNKNIEIKEKLKLSMEEQGIENYENDYIKLHYVKPSKRNTVDTKKLKEKYEDIYLDCLKETNVKSSIRITTKEIDLLEC